MVNKIIAAWYKLMYHKSLKRATKHANHIKCTTGYKCFVLLFPKGYKAITKQAVKQLHKQKYFKKNVSLQHIENMSAYTTT
ncbi:MAG: hypothetical protein JSR11_03680 [Bacteroidetes bacterium]|nr:hypothetical protein [Bacteroidota bacterium]